MTFERFCSTHTEVLYHWWERGSKVERLVEITKYGTYADAAMFNRKLFT